MFSRRRFKRSLPLEIGFARQGCPREGFTPAARPRTGRYAEEGQPGRNPVAFGRLGQLTGLRSPK